MNKTMNKNQNHSRDHFESKEQQKKLIYAANWKMHKSPQETKSFLQELKISMSQELQTRTVIFPTAVNLLVAHEVLQGTQIGWGAQNCYFSDQGAFTGENSPALLESIGATHCLVGHSERRSLFHEKDEDCAKKVEAIQIKKMIPLLCVGETLMERESGQTHSIILKQLKKGLERVNWDVSFWLAYEPVWAIGTGKVASPEQVSEVHSVLRRSLSDLMKNEVNAQKIPLLYGGSVKAENAKLLGQQKNVDGFLIGGASLDLHSFLAICV